MAETLITSSVIILMLCAIRILFKGRIRPTVQYGLGESQRRVWLCRVSTR